MKLNILLSAIAMSALVACRQKEPHYLGLQKQLDSLKTELANTYRPGFGEFMSQVQQHHAKLWFAGKAQNWQLADFEIHEIGESIEGIQKYDGDRKESKDVVMLEPALDSVNHAIELKDSVAFRRSYVLLTNTCNKCHEAVNYSFNKVQIPAVPPFSNQVFESK